MKRLNIYGAFQALAGPGTKEDIIIQVAKQQNIRFNELPQLQKEVDLALEESQRLGFIERQGTNYKLITEAQAKNHNNSAANNNNNKDNNNNPKTTASTKANIGNAERSARVLNGQGDGKRSHSAISTRSCHKSAHVSLCSACTGLDPKSNAERRKNPNKVEKIILPLGQSLCSICGLASDNSTIAEDQEADKYVWPNMRAQA